MTAGSESLSVTSLSLLPGADIAAPLRPASPAPVPSRRPVTSSCSIDLETLQLMMSLAGPVVPAVATLSPLKV